MEEKSDLRKIMEEYHEALFPKTEEIEEAWKDIVEEMLFRHSLVKKKT